MQKYCQFTGLPIRQTPGIFEKSGDILIEKASIYFIGRKIIHIIVKCEGNESFVDNLLTKIEKLVAFESGEGDLSVLVQWESLKCCVGLSYKWRFLYKCSTFKGINQVVYYVKSKPERFLFKLESSTVKGISVVKDYELAIKSIVKDKQIQFDKRENQTLPYFPQNISFPMMAKCRISGLDIKYYKDFYRIKLNDTYRVTFATIGNSIIFVIPEGVSGENGMNDLFLKREAFLKKCRLYSKKYIEIKDFSKIDTQITMKGRIQFARNLLKEQNRGFLQGFICFNAPKDVILGLEIGKKLYNPKLTVTVEKNYEKAILLSLRILNNKSNDRSNDRPDDKLTNPFRYYYPDHNSTLSNILGGSNFNKIDQVNGYIEKSVNSVLKILGKINWESELYEFDSVEFEKGSPFYELIDAIKIVKNDFVAILQDKMVIEKQLQHQHKYALLRAAIWKLSLQNFDNEIEFISEILKQVGSSLGVSRASYHEFVMFNKENDYTTCIAEWVNKGIESNLGEKTPNFIVRELLSKGDMFISLETIINELDGAKGILAKPIFKSLQDKHNLDFLAVVPHEVNGVIRGFFSFEIKPELLTELQQDIEIKSIINEMVTIISTHIEKEFVQRKLKETNLNMEERIKQRTIKLNETNKKLRAALVESKELAMAAKQASSSKTQFLANMSHEIRTPLNGILGFSQIIQNSESVNEIHKFSKVITNECRRLNTMLNSVLDLAQIESGKMKLENDYFDIIELLRSIKVIYGIQFEQKNINFILNIDNDLPNIVFGDSLKLRHVITNLLSNAVKFTEKGEVSVSVSFDKNSTGNKIILDFSVSDTGIGIPEHKIPIIFDSFTQGDGSTKRAYGGSGLGTTIAKEMVELMGGKISVKSNLGVGTTFSFNVPLILPSKHKSELPPKFGSNINDDLIFQKVLVVEDYETNQQIMRYHLEQRGFMVKTAANGVEAINHVNSENFDIIFMDVQMPVMDGYDATREIRKIEKTKKHRSKIIGITANAFESDKNNCLNAGMDDFLAKPFEITSFLSMLDGAKQDGTNSEVINEIADDNTVINFDKYLLNFDQNRGVAISLLKKFISHSDEQMGRISEYWESKNLKDLQFEIHALRGGAGTIFAYNLQKITEEIEMLIVNNKTPSDEILENLNISYKKLKKFISELS